MYGIGKDINVIYIRSSEGVLMFVGASETVVGGGRDSQYSAQGSMKALL